ncbi:restriction endonuclease subunit S [Lactobacillus acidophilus]
MSNKEQRKAPILRFKGYTDDWEQRKLKELAVFNPKGKLPEEFEYVDLESVVGTEMISHKKTILGDAPSRAQRLAKKGDIFYQTVRPYQKNDYLFDIKAENYVFSTGYAQIRPKIDGNFLFQLIRTEKFVKTVLNNCTGTSYPAINSKDLANMIVTYTSCKKEQKKIGLLLNNLDNLITLQQRKLNDLDKIQKMLEDSLFPNTKNIRKLKFTQDNWQVRKLKDIFNERNIHNQDEQLLSVSISKGIYPFNSSDRKDNSSSNKSNYKLVEKGDIAYNSMRMWQGACGVSDYKGIVSPAYTVITPHREENARFYFYYFKNNRMKFEFRRHSQGLTSDTWNLKFPLFKNISIETPNNENEQIKISQILNTLNKTMNYNRNRINKLNLFKKFLLQKMFI